MADCLFCKIVAGEIPSQKVRLIQNHLSHIPIRLAESKKHMNFLKIREMV